MAMMERILRLMAEKEASDVYLSPYAPALIKINGQCVPINAQPLAVDSPIKLLAEVLSPTKIEELKDVGELNMAMPIDGVGNFRISAMRQRGTYAAVIRYITLKYPRWKPCRCLLFWATL
jgi:twitching motility protein PilU